MGVGEGIATLLTELAVIGRGGVAASATSVVLNVTVTQPKGAGFVSVYPCGLSQPVVSNLNFAAGQTIPNAVVVKVGTDGKVCLYTLAATHLLVDVGGYFPGAS